MEVVQEKIVTRLVLTVEEMSVLGSRLDPNALPALVQKSLGGNGHSNGHSLPGPVVTVESEPVPYQRALGTGLTYKNCPRCGNRIATAFMKRHQAGAICKHNRKKFRERQNQT